MATFEVTIMPGSNAAAAKKAVKKLLREYFSVDHSTFEIDEASFSQEKSIWIARTELQLRE